LGGQFESLNVNMNDVGRTVISEGSTAQSKEQQRNQDFEKGTGRGLPGHPDESRPA
jgi:hypothetical protein